MRLDMLLDVLPGDAKVAITNENGIGGAAWLVNPDSGWTVDEAIEEVAAAAYCVLSVSVENDGFLIYADESPWNFGSYFDGEWYNEPTREYELAFSATVCVREPNEQAALHMARERIRDLDFDFEQLEIVKVD